MNDNNNSFQNEPHCPRCGASLPANASFCGNCGLSLRQDEPDVLSVGDYVIMLILFSIPVVGLVLMLYWGFGRHTRVNRRHFARAYLIFYVINLLFSMFTLAALGSITAGVVESGVSLF